MSSEKLLAHYYVLDFQSNFQLFLVSHYYHSEFTTELASFWSISKALRRANVESFEIETGEGLAWQTSRFKVSFSFLDPLTNAGCKWRAERRRREGHCR